MQTYAYKALTADGAEARGVVQAMDEYDAANQIKEKYKIITSLSPVGEKKSLIPAGSILTKDLDPRVKTRDLALMCSQFAITLKSGIPIGRAISMIGNQTKDKKLKKILLDAAENVTGGMTVANAFERHKEAFPITFLRRYVPESSPVPLTTPSGAWRNITRTLRRTRKRCGVPSCTRFLSLSSRSSC